MKLTLQAREPGTELLGCLVLFLTEEGSLPKGLDKSLRKTLENALLLKDFTGKKGQTQLVHGPEKTPQRVLLVGLGKADQVDHEGLRRAAGSATQALRGLNLSRAGLWMPSGLDKGLQPRLAEVIAEGALLGAYVYEQFKTAPEEDKGRQKLSELMLYDPEGLAAKGSLEQGVIRAEAACLTRDLGNAPANEMTPSRLAEEAQKLAKKHGLKYKALDKKQMEKLGMGMFLGVTAGSRQPPRLIVLEYSPRGAKGTVAIVGKGITFDSGGISLKPGQAMDEMKFDMCGGAAVLGAMEAVARLKPKVNVVGIVPACENLPDGESVKPGDILRSYSGKQVEILNTDAEGRLILGDALAWGIEQYKPDAVVDLATLTGACVVALGHYATGAISNDEKLTARVVTAGKSSGDIVWPLPAFEEYGEGLKGKYADLQNITPGRDAGTISAGLFLKHFVGKVPWVHLDIAGTAWGVKSVGHIPNEGATGVGVRLLADLLCNWNEKE
ncbi:MAG: leucyl aminopeptidase [Deltaproteobacteria bacterium]|nr:leucyl aminopeptidase [Deltaproteobacteria bacterium]